MFNNEKKTVFINGSVHLPLKVGTRAIIYHNGGSTWTSTVLAIHRLAEDLIVFETRNSTYCVSLKHSPVATAAANYLPALCA